MINYLCFVLFFYIFLTCVVVTTPKLSPPEPGNYRKLGECQVCKVLTDSFSHWLDKTSRGKFDGGDAVWEETKLRSYSRSEVRLVEIQEGLCSELKKHKDQCYSLAEEAEQPLEQWWFRNDAGSADLYTWLCVDTLTRCCQQNHFGPTCEPCSRGDNMLVCSGLGSCDGEGTRSGDGSCKCRKSYSGPLCQDCARNFYKSSDGVCEACSRACDGCDGPGLSACLACRPGWVQKDGQCQDIDECQDTTKCTPNSYCSNSEGSYSCKICDKSCDACTGEGSENCTECAPGHVLMLGSCVSYEYESILKKKASPKILLYVGLLAITVFVFRKSKLLASIVIIVVAIYIYVSENTSKVSNYSAVLDSIGS